MLSSGDLDYMRQSIEQLLPDACDILQEIRASDGQGGWTTTWGTVSAGIPCRIDAVNANARNNEIVIGAALRPFHTFILSLPNGTEINETNRVAVNGRVFNVTAVDSGKSWSAVVRAVLEVV